MMDRLKIEAVKEAVRRCKGNAIFPNSDCPNCPYDVFDGDECRYKLLSDVIEILDSMKPLEAIIVFNGVDMSGGWWYQCPKCKMEIEPRDKYCKSCGQAVKWE